MGSVAWHAFDGSAANSIRDIEERESRGCHASQECAVARFLCPGTTVTYSLSPTAGLKCDVSRSICRFLDLYVV